MRRSVLAVLVGCAACSKPAATEGTLAYFRANPEVIAPGTSTQLEWSASHASGCTISPDVGAVPAQGTTLVSPAATTTYSIDCGGASQVLEVQVLATVAITAFTATPGEVGVDGIAHLAWSTVGADGCSLAPNLGPVETTGVTDAHLSATTTFTLSCTGYLGPARATATVTVVPLTHLDPPANLTLTPGDGTLTASWVEPLGSADLYVSESPGITVANFASLDGGFVLRKVSSPQGLGGLVNGRTYYAAVTAVSGTLVSELSAEVSGTPAAAASLGDPAYSLQWHLKNTGQSGATAGEDLNAEPAWTDFKGTGVRVAIVDEGVDFGHEDLWQNVVPWRSHDYLGTSPLRLAEHGTCVAGLVAARDGNGKGLRGVAPRASMVSYNVLQDLTAANEYDSMTRGKDVNGASNNSWGVVADGTGQLSYPEPLWLRGVKEGTAQGRGGKGVVYLWAAGNGGDEVHQDRSDYDGQANSYYVMSIGGVGDDGVKASYSEEGSNVLVVTPTQGNSGQALTTTDLTGPLGYNNGRSAGDLSNLSYTKTMNGTSGATPLAAGVVALVLEANPSLTWRDVRRVLARSARKNDPADADWTLNGAGLHVNHKYGFGVADAKAAVDLAKTFVAGAPVVDATSSVSAPALAIPDNDATGVSDTLTVAASGIARLDFVEVQVTLTHPRSGDLDLVLSHAGGASSVFLAPHACDRDPVTRAEACTDLAAYVFGTVRHLDEPADGAWTLTARDKKVANTGSLAQWKLIFHGRP